MEAPLYHCSLCKAKMPSASMRYSRDGKRLVCINCFNRVVKLEGGKRAAAPERTAADCIRLICTKCRYKFNYKKGSRVALKCPYCGSPSLMKAEATAAKLLQEAEQDIYS